jgi:hypothetical protein
MTRLHFNKYYLNGTVLMTAAVALLGIALLTNRGTLTGAGLVIAGFASFLVGIFFLTYSGGEPVDPSFVSLLPVQDRINICRVMGDLGINGVAYVLPENRETGSLRQFNPAGAYQKPPVGDDHSFRLTPPVGMNTLPSGFPLYRQLVEAYGWTSPSDPLHVALGIKEVTEDVYRMADRADASFDQDLFTIRLNDFRYIAGCAAVQKEASPVCCRMHPCPVCSLMMCIIAENLNVPCTIEQTEIDQTSGTLTLMVRILPEVQELSDIA